MMVAVVVGNICLNVIQVHLELRLQAQAQEGDPIAAVVVEVAVRMRLCRFALAQLWQARTPFEQCDTRTRPPRLCQFRKIAMVSTSLKWWERQLGTVMTTWNGLGEEQAPFDSWRVFSVFVDERDAASKLKTNANKRS